MGRENSTLVTEFILLGLASKPEEQLILFGVFTVIYLVALIGNMLILLLVSLDSRLHTPMYFFLGNLSVVDIGYISSTVPKMLANYLSRDMSISWAGCLSQMFFFLSFGGIECLILGVMAYDRYVAICHPLHYCTFMRRRVCALLLVAGAWTMSFFFALVNTLFLLNVNFCGPNEVNHFICELPSLLALSCTKTFINEVVLLTSVVIFGLSSFIPILVSYIHIISTILRIHSAEDRSKAFSTCSSHLTVVCLLYLTALFQYMKPNAAPSVILNELFSIQYSILTPMLNPIIYSLKNKEVKMALWKIYSSSCILDQIGLSTT
uniref:Olfactory receptor n=1 Tax=Chrysemys picta bellii TaxID=8478 RepID=A0A8C3IE25_CHRPI